MENLTKSGVYLIKNTINNKLYVGSAKNVKNRFNAHKYSLKKNSHDNPLLQNAWNKYGEEHFIFEMIEECDLSIILLMEQHYLDLYKSYDRNKGYNILRIAGSSYGYKFSEESRKKMSLAKKGLKPRIGSKLSDDTKKKIGDANRGRVPTQETRDKISNSNKGKIRTNEMRKNVSNGLRGLIKSKEWIEKIRQKNMGRKTSDETKNKLRGRIVTEETRKKISEGLKNKKLGSDNPMSKLSNEIVLSIKHDFKFGSSVKELSYTYNIPYQTIYKIVNNIRWAWLKLP